MVIGRRPDERAAGGRWRRLRRHVVVAVACVAVGVGATVVWLAGGDAGGRLSTERSGRAPAFDLENVATRRTVSD